MPEASNRAGVLIAPPHSTTSLPARAYSARPRRSHRTPTTRGPQNTKPVTWAPVTTVRFGRAAIGRR
jgi:hypothetical protein